MTDIFRDTWIRYLGYANEVGEAFRPLVPVNWVRASYVVSTAYMVADTIDKSIEMSKMDNRTTKVLTATGDALIWQFLASVAIPGFTINRVCAGSLYAFNRLPMTSHWSPRARVFTTVMIGLSTIPFIVHPIDNAVTYVMDNTYRKVLK